MYRILTASKDTYITNKIIDNKFRATDANTGEAGTLDLFKLYNENLISGEATPIELSKIMIKFPISEVTRMDSEKLIDISDSTFKCFISLHDVYGGQTTPSNFKIINSDGTPLVWNTAGAGNLGILNADGVDCITSGTLDASEGLVSLSSAQFFEKGNEDLLIDVTKIVSGTVAGIIPDKGFLISYSGSYELNDKTYFVKRFASRNATVLAKRPKMIIKFNDSIQDNHEDFIFNVTSSLYLLNYH